MKTFIASLALVAVVASPALAKSSHANRQALSAYAQAPVTARYSSPDSERAYLQNGFGYGAWAADANIRLEERRDALTGHE
jgi:hypothetical protein